MESMDSRESMESMDSRESMESMESMEMASWIPIKLCSCFGYCRRRFFSPAKGGPRFVEHVHIEEFVFFMCLVNYRVFPTLDIAAGAFLPQQKAVPDFLDMSKLRNLCFIDLGHPERTSRVRVP